MRHLNANQIWILQRKENQNAARKKTTENFDLDSKKLGRRPQNEPGKTEEQDPKFFRDLQLFGGAQLSGSWYTKRCN
jgi:hypothetical protein